MSLRVCSLLLCITLAAGLSRNQEDKPKKHSHEHSLEAVELVDNFAEEGKPVKQYLRSDEGMAYYGILHVGGQPQQAIYDTGSFDLVVESRCDKADEKTMKSRPEHKKGWTTSFFGDDAGLDTEAICCPSKKCPQGAYDMKRSGLYKKAKSDPETITYGSGSVLVHTATDHVEIRSTEPGKNEKLSLASTRTGMTSSKLGMKDVPVSVIMDHNIDLFTSTSLQAIVGIGPGDFEERKSRMISHLGIKRFTMCFQEDQNKEGMITWNDEAKEGQKGWVDVPVQGKMFWAVVTSEFKLRGDDSFYGLVHDTNDVGCNPSCGAVIDSGTSLLTPPSTVIDKITNLIEHGKIEDCSDMSKFPTLTFKLGDKMFSLPPTSYLADVGDEVVSLKQKNLAFPLLPMNKEASKQLRLARLQGKPEPAVHSCALMLSESDDSESTPWGPMVIFGMSLFRKYAVQFDLSKDFEGVKPTLEQPSRFMRFAEASADCETTKAASFRQRSHNTMHKANLNKMRVSPLQMNIVPTRRALKKHTNANKAVNFVKTSRTQEDKAFWLKTMGQM